MQARCLDGKQLSRQLKDSIKTDIAASTQAGLRAPGLAVILVGNDPASEIYVGHKHKACQTVGIISKNYHLPTNTTQDQLQQLIASLNTDPNVDGILLQLPLPEHLQASSLIEQISPMKDVDGFHPYSIGLLAQRQPKLRPCTPMGIISLLDHYQIELEGTNATVVGASNIVGRPMSLELLLRSSTVTVCHRFTKNLKHFVQQADLLVVAVGKPNIVKSEWIKPGAVVVDVGMHRLDNGQLIGDIEHASACQRASWITPVPGGVGPMTIASLLQNTLLAANSR